MSLPNIPNITPDISLSRCETLNLLLSSVAMEEIGLSHILQAEAEKIQKYLDICGEPSFKELLAINKSAERLLRTVMKSQLLLQTKLEDIIYLQDSESCMDPSDPEEPCVPEHPCPPEEPCNSPEEPCDPYFPNPPPHDGSCDDLFYGCIDCCCECEECEGCGCNCDCDCEEDRRERS